MIKTHQNQTIDSEIFAKRLRLQLIKNQMTQAQLAELVGCTRDRISRYTHGEKPRWARLEKIAAALELEPAFLAGQLDAETSIQLNYIPNRPGFCKGKVDMELTLEQAQRIMRIVTNVKVSGPVIGMQESPEENETGGIGFSQMGGSGHGL